MEVAIVLRAGRYLVFSLMAFGALGLAAARAEPLVVAGQEPTRIDRIEIATFGIFSPGDVTKRIEAPGTNGLTLREGRKLLSQTETVPGRIGTTFGINYTLVGSPKGKVVRLTYVTRFPAGGMVNDKGERLEKSQFDWDDTIGAPATRTYTLDHAWEIVPGEWNLEFYYEGRKIGEKHFTVTAADR